MYMKDLLDCNSHMADDCCIVPIRAREQMISTNQWFIEVRGYQLHTFRRWQASHARFVGIDMAISSVKRY